MEAHVLTQSGHSSVFVKQAGLVPHVLLVSSSFATECSNIALE